MKIFCTTLLFIFQVNQCGSLNWKAFRCATDDIDSVPAERVVPNSRFPWLGIIQHRFYLAERNQYAITQGVLIHPGYVMAPAEDISRIPSEQILNRTDFIIWGSAGEKYSLEIIDSIMHPDFTNNITIATIALLQLSRWADGHRPAPVDPICLPFKGMGSFDNLFAVKLDDSKGDINKQIMKMNYVERRDCSEFYFRAQLSLDRMAPQYPLCAVVAPPDDIYPLAPCIWDGGVLLITRLNNAYWTLLGFGVRGPGCGAPSRYSAVHQTLTWIDDAISQRPLEDIPEDHTAFYLRQFSPYELVLYKADIPIPSSYGTCEHGSGRGNVEFKDNSEIESSSAYGSGFYLAAVHSVALFTCGTVKIISEKRSILALWLEHNCYVQSYGHAPDWAFNDQNKTECFHYFKTTAYMEFRFIFSFQASIYISLYGKKMPDTRGSSGLPWAKWQRTDEWTPTKGLISPVNFQPAYWDAWD